MTSLTPIQSQSPARCEHHIPRTERPLKRHRTLQVAQAFLKSRPPAGEGEFVILAPRAVSSPLSVELFRRTWSPHPSAQLCDGAAGRPLDTRGLEGPAVARLRRVTRFIGENALAPPRSRRLLLFSSHATPLVDCWSQEAQPRSLRLSSPQLTFSVAFFYMVEASDAPAPLRRAR